MDGRRVRKWGEWWLYLVVCAVFTRLLVAEPDTAGLEKRLVESTGRQRLGLLVEVANATRVDDPATSIARGSEALELLRSIPDDSLKMEVSVSLCGAYFRQGQYADALPHGARAERLAGTANDKAALAAALNCLGDVYRALSEYRRALDLARQAIPLLRQIGDNSALAAALNDAGVSCRRIGDYPQALDYYFQSLRLSEELGDPSGVARALNNLGIVHRQLDQYDEARDFYQQALDIRTRQGNQATIARLLNNLGVIDKLSGNTARAIASYQRSLAIKDQRGDRRGAAATLNNLGLAYEELGELDRADDYYRRSLTIKEEIGDRKGIVGTLHHVASIHRRRGEYTQAVDMFRRAIATATELGLNDDLEEGYAWLSQTYAEMGRYQEALAALKKHQEAQSEIFDERNSQRVAELQARFESDRQKKEIEILRQQQAIDALELKSKEAVRRTVTGGLALVLLVGLLTTHRVRIRARQRRRLEEQRRRRQERERYIAELEAKNTEVETRNAEMERFTYTVSHDLKTPLITIRGFLGLLKQDVEAGDEDRAHKDIERIHRAAGKMGHLLDELLDLSRVGRMMNTPQDVPMSELAHEAVELLTAPITACGAEVEIASDLPRAFGDRPRLLEVWQNLIENAVKFSAGEPQPKVVVGCRPQGDGHGDGDVFFVQDYGIGIAPTYHDKVFDLFERLDQTVDGTGIGLALVKRIVEVHGGRIWVESEGEGKGSAFCFTLPLSAAAPSGHRRAPLRSGAAEGSRP